MSVIYENIYTHKNQNPAPRRHNGAVPQRTNTEDLGLVANNGNPSGQSHMVEVAHSNHPHIDFPPALSVACL